MRSALLDGGEAVFEGSVGRKLHTHRGVTSGRHFLVEDHPRDIADELRSFLERRDDASRANPERSETRNVH